MSWVNGRLLLSLLIVTVVGKRLRFYRLFVSELGERGIGAFGWVGVAKGVESGLGSAVPH